jgi:hypothetical protein
MSQSTDDLTPQSFEPSPPPDLVMGGDGLVTRHGMEEAVRAGPDPL